MHIHKSSKANYTQMQNFATFIIWEEKWPKILNVKEVSKCFLFMCFFMSFDFLKKTSFYNRIFLFNKSQLLYKLLYNFQNDIAEEQQRKKEERKKPPKKIFTEKTTMSACLLKYSFFSFLNPRSCQNTLALTARKTSHFKAFKALALPKRYCVNGSYQFLH